MSENDFATMPLLIAHLPVEIFIMGEWVTFTHSYNADVMTQEQALEALKAEHAPENVRLP